MKKIVQVCLTGLPWLLFLMFTPRVFCNQRIHCQWGPYGEWSECDGCTKLQTRSRAMAVYAQFGGNPCYGQRDQSQTCETTQGCPLEDGCGNRFRCRSGMCISMSLVCNGDQDCEEDNLDELGCDQRHACLNADAVLPPNIELLGLGFDAVSGEWRGSVINTKSFGGQCRSIFSGLHNNLARLPLSTIRYNFMTTVQNDFSDEMYSSKWHYAKDRVNRETASGTTSGYSNYDFHETDDRTQNRKLVILKNNIEVAQFQNNAPQYLPISEELWKVLAKLPAVYNYATYRTVLERFGTHYLSEGSLGGSFKAIVSISQETSTHTVKETWRSHECDKTKRWILFWSLKIEKCRRHEDDRSSENHATSTTVVRKVEVEGGGPQHIAALKTMDPTNQRKNWEFYTNWADSVRSFPQIIKQKLRPLSELVKEVQCAGVKRVYLRRAIEQYLAENDPCHCRPCSNNGLVVRNKDECKCLCKPGTGGLACEHGTELEGQQGVIHGSWSCWSRWSSCSGGQRSRSRSCSNPTPQNAGQHCIGENTQTSDCEDQELQYLKTMEPQCFDLSLPAKEKCGTPPALINGYVLEPKDVYLVGSRVEYTCTEGFYLLGNSIECTAAQTWSGSPGLCTISRCKIESLSDDITASPLKQSYGIGEKITLSCPEGRPVVGETEMICDPSLHFSPDPAGTTCSEVVLPQIVSTPATLQCKPWEKLAKGKCVCRMPYECTSSLELCATNPVRGSTALLNVCKMHALQCLRKNHTLAEDSACQWPQRTITACTKCHMWETCDGLTNECRCKDSADCLVPGFNVCVRLGADETAGTQTMSECEAGLRRCKGEKLSVVSIMPCAA